MCIIHNCLKSGGVEIMRVFVQAKNGIPLDYDHFNAYCGFREMGFEVVFFENHKELSESSEEDVVVGYIGTVRRRLEDFNVEIVDTDYPICLEKYLGRKMWKATINEINANPDLWPVFVKPINNKKFVGRAIYTPADLIGCGSCYENAPVICSEVLDVVAEYRTFVRYGKIIDVRRYKGEWNIYPDADVIKSCVEDYVDAPFGYAIDFGVTRDGKTVLIEVNNTCSLGSYGLFCVDYAKLLSARWSELMNTEDECNF